MEIEWEKEILYKDLVKWEKRLITEAPFFKEILSSIQSISKRILDVSCGTGFHLVMFAKWGYEGVGIDISDQNVEEARKLSEESSTNQKAQFIIGDILELDEFFEDNKFDLIILIGNTFSIFSLEEREKILNSMIELLNDKGKIVIQVVNYLSHSQEKEWFYNPNLSRDEQDQLVFHNRVMEWKEKEKKVTMYVHKIQQESVNSDDFSLQTKKTEFFVVRTKDFGHLVDNKNLKFSFFGDYHFEEFDEKKSNDLVIILERFSNHHKDL